MPSCCGVLGPRPRQRMRRAGWQSDSDSVATSRDRGPACDRSEGRSEEDGSEDRNVVEDCRGGSSEGRVRIGVRIGVSPALSCPPRARLVVAAPSSPCCRARVIGADVVIASTWPQSSPCPRRRRAVVPAPSSPRRRLRVAAASSPRHRPRTVVSVPLLNPHPYPHLYPHPMSSPVVVRPRLYTLTSLRHPHPVLA